MVLDIPEVNSEFVRCICWFGRISFITELHFSQETLGSEVFSEIFVGVVSAGFCGFSSEGGRVFGRRKISKIFKICFGIPERRMRFEG